MTDNRTQHLNLQLPDPNNPLEIDVLRLISAFNALDAKIATIDTVLTSDDVTLDTVQELVSAIKGDAATVTSILTSISTLNQSVVSINTALSGKQESLVSGTNIKTINGGSILGSGNLAVGIDVLSYENRGNLRSLSPANNTLIEVEGLGIFLYQVGNTELDDDETCFATDSGRWLLQAVGWDFVDGWVYQTYIDMIEGQPIYASVTPSTTYVSPQSQVSFTATVSGAVVGDVVVINPPSSLSPYVAIYGYVNAADTVTVYINNPHPTYAASFSQGSWKIAVLKTL